MLKISYRSILLQLVSGFCVAFGQPAFFSVLGVFASVIGFSLFWKSLEKFPQKTIFKMSFVWFFLVQLIQLSWLANLEYQGIYILIPYVGVCAGVALQFAFMTKILYKLPKLDLWSTAFLAGIWTLFEWIRFYFLCGFAFNFVGVFLSCHLFPLQIASLFGVLGMSFWVMFSNLIGLQALRSFSLSSVAKWGLVIAVPYLYGFLHIAYHDYNALKEKQKEYSVLLVQPALTPSQKYLLRGREEDFIPSLEQWSRMVEWISFEKGQSLDLIAFPEAVVPFGLDQYVYKMEEVNSVFLHRFGERIQSCFPEKDPPFVLEEKVSNAYWAQTISNFFNAEVLVGLDFQEKNGVFYNSIFHFEPGALAPQRYDKRILLPLAEYMPFSFLTSLSKYYGISDFFTPGVQPEIFSKKMFISPSICYEELFPTLMREGRKKGANFFVNASNDGWYPSSKLSFQHFTHGLIRSVENGVPLVRACNTGVTAAVDSLGRVVAKLQSKDGDVEKISGCLSTKISTYQYKTGFVLWGESPLIIGCFSFVFIGCFRVFLRHFSFRKWDISGNRS